MLLAALFGMQQEIARGVDRNRAITKARKAGATLKSIGDGISKEWVRQIAESAAQTGGRRS